MHRGLFEYPNDEVERLILRTHASQRLMFLSTKSGRHDLISARAVIIMLQNQHRDWIFELIKALPIFDLVRFARVNKVAAQCARIEVIARIGQRNYDIVSTAQECSTAEIKYFYRTVRDADAYIPLTIALRRRYTHCNIDYITCHFIHVGLINCARLLRVSKGADIFAYQDSCPAANTREWQHEMHARRDHDMMNFFSRAKREPRHITPAPDELLWYALEYMSSYQNESIVMTALDQLDMRYFGLLVEIIGTTTHKLSKSNDKCPRYKHLFVWRCLDRFVAPTFVRSFYQRVDGCLIDNFTRDAVVGLMVATDVETPVDTYLPCSMCSIH